MPTHAPTTSADSISGPWMQAASGRAVPILHPGPADIDIYDIATALSRIPRFNGHTTHPYSVAQHSVYVHDMAPTALRPYALLHDAHEAYLGDIIKPLREALAELVGTDALGEIKKRFDAAIFAAFDLSWPLAPRRAEILHRLDMQALSCERRDLLTIGGREWDAPLPIPTGPTIVSQSAEKSREEFLYLCRWNGFF